MSDWTISAVITSRLPDRQLCRFDVAGRSIAQPRARAAASIVDGEAKVVVYEAASKHDIHLWKGYIRHEAKLAMGALAPYDGALLMEILYRMPRPAKLGKQHVRQLGDPGKEIFHVMTPDLDNLEKALQDACSLVVYTDDRRIAGKVVWKVYAKDGHPPGATVRFAKL